jgi:urea transport system ATP-binding protein
MLSVENVDLKYGAAQVLWDVSLKAEPSKITCVMGRNGVGKTSLLRGIIGHQPISGGKIMWEGRNIAGLPPFERARRGLGYVPQGREIFPLLTVRENLESGYAAIRGGKREIPDDVFELFPVLKTMLSRRGGDLSGGQQQQLAIGRAMVTKPSLMIFDEPTEGIQPSVIKDIGRAILYLRDKGEMAIILVEQYFDFAVELADNFVVMDRGQVVMAGAKADMVEQNVRRHLTV